MKGKKRIFLIVLALLSLSANGYAGDWQWGVGFSAGTSRLEGDLRGSQLSPLVTGYLRALPIPYLALDGELGFSSLRTSSFPNPVFSDFKTVIVPFELSAIFNFLPRRKVNPYVQVGGGGVFWQARGDLVAGGTRTLEDGLDSFLKTGGGFEFRVSPSVALDLGADYRFSLTDAFDQLRQGDENDQVLDVHAGVTYYFGGRSNDRDRDLIIDELDLMPDISEDRDGYMDHDGIPEKNPSPLVMGAPEAPLDNANVTSAPLVVHHIIEAAETGKDIAIKAQVVSDVQLKVVAALYRPNGTRSWNVVKLDALADNKYQGDIPGYAVTSAGLEYCVIAVDETLSGIGYSGLPSKPINVKATKSGTIWRVLGASVGTAAIGTASYVVLRKQK